MEACDTNPGADNIKIGNRRFMCTEFKARHLAAIEKEVLAVRSDPLAEIIPQLNQLTETQQEVILSMAYEQLSRTPTVTEGEIEAYLQSINGFSHALWLCIHDLQPNVSREDIIAEVGDLSTNSLNRLSIDALHAMRLELGQELGNESGQVQSGKES